MCFVCFMGIKLFCVPKALRTRSEGYTRIVLGLSFCPSVTTFSATTRNKTAKSDVKVQCHTGLILNCINMVGVNITEKDHLFLIGTSTSSYSSSSSS